jgi:hypothetical protein
MKLHPVLLALALTACPEAPADLEGGQQIGGNGGPATPSGDPGVPGNPGEAPAIDATMDEPKHSQDDLKDSPDAVKIGGEIRCEEGGGPYRVRVFVPPPSEGGPDQDTEGEPPGPLAAATFSDAGSWEMYTPKGSALKLLAYADADENGVPTPEETQFGTPDGGVLDLSASKMDINLDCSASAPVPKPIPANTEDGPTGDAPPDLGGALPEGGTIPEGGMMPEGGPGDGPPAGPPPTNGPPKGPPPEGAPSGPPPEEG